MFFVVFSLSLSCRLALGANITCKGGDVRALLTPCGGIATHEVLAPAYGWAT